MEIVSKQQTLFQTNFTCNVQEMHSNSMHVCGAPQLGVPPDRQQASGFVAGGNEHHASEW
jgi:hypothetical protein